MLGVLGSRAGGLVGSASRAVTSAGLGAVQKIPGAAMLGQKRWLILAISVAVDAAGMASYLIPGLGEAEDVVSAPVSALLVKALYGSNIMASLDFFEEVSPSATESILHSSSMNVSCSWIHDRVRSQLRTMTTKLIFFLHPIN